ncbi:uncharacterized protein LOC122385338 [Amphibalanus amphitrite]|uniref:uncharacterized protein LOC122385338 n=1 Tax=Amphibalanus amphitrite TaxID=1232801 RepID=UPI001C918DC3|nr:uncharacterized protein LOC122385338 [Amphibalanus amphitrite]
MATVAASGDVSGVPGPRSTPAPVSDSERPSAAAVCPATAATGTCPAGGVDSTHFSTLAPGDPVPACQTLAPSDLRRSLRPRSPEPEDAPDEHSEPHEHQCWQLYQKLRSNGVKVSYDVIKRGMLTPTEYKRCSRPSSTRSPVAASAAGNC